MNKTIIIFAFLVIVVAYTEATNPRCRPICRKNQPSMIRCVKDINGCRKMKQCSIEEENCRRQQSNQRRLTSVSSSYCRNIRGPLGSGHCAPKKPVRIPRNARPDCRRLRCTNPSKKLNCYRNRNNKCQLLTACQLNRVNCQLGRHNALSWTNDRHCNNMMSGQSLQQCRPIPKRG